MEKKAHTNYKHETFGCNLNAIMVAKKISNQHLATKLTVAASTISGYRTGRRSPNIAELKRLAEVLQVSVSDLIVESPNDFVDNLKETM